MGELDYFYIVGAAKSGTTSLYHYLDKHPDVYMSPIKEPHYFCKDIRSENFNRRYQKEVCFDIDKYLEKMVLEKKHIAYIDSFEKYSQLFREQINEKIAGEASTGYLYSEVAAEKIYKFNSDAKIVIVLRNPIERAFSHWIMDLRSSNVCRSSFCEAIREDQDSTRKGWGKSHLYIEIGLYHKQVKRYLDVFPREKVLILFYDELRDNPTDFFKKLFNFLKIEYLSIDVTQRYNSASIPKYTTLNAIMKKIRLNQLATKYFPESIKKKVKNALSTSDNLLKLTTDDRANTLSYFEADIMSFEKLIGRDLSAWRLTE